MVPEVGVRFPGCRQILEEVRHARYAFESVRLPSGTGSQNRRGGHGPDGPDAARVEVVVVDERTWSALVKALPITSGVHEVLIRHQDRLCGDYPARPVTATTRPSTTGTDTMTRKKWSELRASHLQSPEDRARYAEARASLEAKIPAYWKALEAHDAGQEPTLDQLRAAREMWEAFEQARGP
jgi:hypothetical protein